MKILQFIYELVPGGAERLVVDLTNELTQLNDLVLYTLRDDALKNKGFYLSELNQEVKYKNLKIEPGFKPWLVWTFFKILWHEKPDVVHCHLNLVNYFFLLSIIFRKKIRFIYTIHSTAEAEVNSEIERIIRRYFFKHRFFTPVAISEETKKSYLKFYKLNDIDVIINGRRFENKSVAFETVLDEVNKIKNGKDSLVFCHLARYDRLKNQEMLILVFNKLRMNGYKVDLLILGEGYENAINLKAIARDHIHFLGIKTNVTDYLYASDAFCLSSYYEGMPISLIEALACGCIPICTPVGGCIDTIKHGETGFLSKTVSEEDFYEAVLQFIDQRNTIDKNNLIKLFHTNFSIELCAENYLKLYSHN